MWYLKLRVLRNSYALQTNPVPVSFIVSIIKPVGTATAKRFHQRCRQVHPTKLVSTPHETDYVTNASHKEIHRSRSTEHGNAYKEGNQIGNDSSRLS